MSIEQESVGSAIAPALSSLEMGAVLGTYEKALKTPQIQEARNHLVGNEQIGRFDRMIELFAMAGGHGMLSLKASYLIDRATVDFPESSVGENSIVLYLLMLGAVSRKSADALTNIKTSYIEQMRNLGESLGKTPNKLQLPDLGEAIINNSFNPEPFEIGDDSFTGNTFIVPITNWNTVLPQMIEKAESGDRIIVQTDAMKELGEIALARMRPGENISFIVEE